ncbi:hypothetical protein ACPOLB_15740 [Rubrivivax sp. RP6-9]|uniref:hypothetical protein n=1 Tax=Rubrivivax sp. RP6-9 TaxID=3415750 RepID=UPI003CC5568C
MSTHLRRPHCAPAVAAMPADDDQLPGCGWFDSSHELQRGLLVTEHTCADGVVHALPLADWLALHLNGWRGQPAALGG